MCKVAIEYFNSIVIVQNLHLNRLVFIRILVRIAFIGL